MLRLFSAWLPGVLVLCAASTLFAQATDERYLLPTTATLAGAEDRTQEQATPAPPAWNDRASVYLAAREQAAEGETCQCTEAGQCAGPSQCAESGQCAVPRVFDDPRVAQAAYRQEDRHAERAEPVERQLAPLSRELRANEPQSAAAASLATSWGLPLDSLVTTIAALVLVVGLFLLCVWALRRGSRFASGLLPKDAVAVLGSTPLGGRQMAQLLRVGNKLVLVSVTPSGASPLVEVTDPAEVDRLLGLCLQGEARSEPNGYDRTFRRTPPDLPLKGLPSIESPLAKTPPASDLFRAYQGGTERA